MKRILLVCCMLLSAAVASFAQTSGHPIPDPVSKPDFIAKVAELNTLLTAGNTTAANAKWTELTQMINGEMAIYRYSMQDAMDAHNEADKAHYLSLSVNQRKLYADALQLKVADMVANKALISQKLNAFSDNML